MPFQYVTCPSLTPFPSHGRQVLSIICRDSDASVLKHLVRLLRDLRFQLFQMKQQVDSLIQNEALVFRQPASVDSNPHVLLYELGLDGFCAIRNMAAHCCFRLFGIGSVMVLPTWFAPYRFIQSFAFAHPYKSTGCLHRLLSSCYNSMSFIVSLSLSLPGDRFDLSSWSRFTGTGHPKVHNSRPPVHINCGCTHPIQAHDS